MSTITFTASARLGSAAGRPVADREPARPPRTAFVLAGGVALGTMQAGMVGEPEQSGAAHATRHDDECAEAGLTALTSRAG